MKKSPKPAVLSGLLAAMFTLSAHAALYSYTDNTAPGVVPQDGTTFSSQQVVSGIPSIIASPGVEIILTFNDNASLTGNSSGIQGLLDLGTGTSSPFVSFEPTGTPVAGSQERTYTATFTSLDGDNPNATWGLVLWDNSTSGIENGLVSWTLDITAVPEPVNYALAGFGVLFVGGSVGRFYLVRGRSSTGKKISI
jgi:hypothetical protein